MKHGVGHAIARVKVELSGCGDLAVDIDDVSHHSEEQFPDTPHHAAIDESSLGRIVECEPDAAKLGHDLDLKVGVSLEQLEGIVGLDADVKHGQRASAEDIVLPAGTAVSQALDLVP